MLSPLHRSKGVTLSKSRRTAKHTDEPFDTAVGLPAAITGKRYFEVIINLNRGGIIAGWTLKQDQFKNKEIGSDVSSWGISSYFGNKGTQDKWTQYAQKMKNGDCIGCIVDTELRNISFTLNGLGNGVAFSKLPPGPYFPGISLKHKKTNVSVNLGATPFKFLPEGCLPLTHMPEPIAIEEAKANTVEEENNRGRIYSLLVPEILSRVLSYLDAKSLTRAALASRLWSKLAAEAAVWEQVYKGMLRMGLSKEVPSAAYKSRCSVRYTMENSYANLSQVFPCKATPDCLQFDSSRLICGAGDVLAVFEDCFDDEGVLTRRRVEGHQGTIKDLQYNDTVLVTISDDQSVKIWDVDDYDCTATIRFPYDGGVNNVRFSNNSIYTYRGCSLLTVYDMNTLQQTHTFRYNEAPGSGNAIMDISDDGRTIFLASNQLLAIDARSFTTIHSLPVEADFITLCHGLTQEGLVCCWKDATFTLHDVFTTSSPSEPVLEFEGSAYGMSCIYSDYGFVGAGFEGCDVRLWDVKTGNIVTEIPQACILQPTCLRFDEGKVDEKICGSSQTKCNMYTFGHTFDDTPGFASESDKAMVRKWNSRMRYYDSTI